MSPLNTELPLKKKLRVSRKRFASAMRPTERTYDGVRLTRWHVDTHVAEDIPLGSPSAFSGKFADAVNKPRGGARILYLPA
jgi:hypothetical protein